MKILWLSQNLPFPPKTGVLQRNFNLIAQASAFAEIDLVAILKEDILPDFDAALAATELAKICKSIEVVRLPIEESRLRLLATVGISVLTKAPFSVNWASANVLRETLRRRVNGNHYDLAYIDTISLAQYRDLLDDIPSVLNHHNIESQLFLRRIAFERSFLKRAYYRLESRKLGQYESAVCAEFDVNFTVSELDAERLRGISTAAKTCVIANGVDTDYFSRTSSAINPNRIIMVSGMNWFPNRDAVIYFLRDIWPRIARAFPAAELQIVGASPPEDVVDASRVDPRIEVTGFVDDVRPYMSSAAVYVCPMRDGGGTRLKILDALSMELPVVATTMAVEGIGVEPERDVLIGDTPKDFSDQVTRALQDSQLRGKLSKNARAFVEKHYSWNVIGSTLRAECSRLAHKVR